MEADVGAGKDDGKTDQQEEQDEATDPPACGGMEAFGDAVLLDAPCDGQAYAGESNEGPDGDHEQADKRQELPVEEEAEHKDDDADGHWEDAAGEGDAEEDTIEADGSRIDVVGGLVVKVGHIGSSFNLSVETSIAWFLFEGLRFPARWRLHLRGRKKCRKENAGPEPFGYFLQ